MLNSLTRLLCLSLWAGSLAVVCHAGPTPPVAPPGGSTGGTQQEKPLAGWPMGQVERDLLRPWLRGQVEQDLRTTAQQYQDAQRFLAQVQAELQAAQVARQQALAAQRVAQLRLDAAQKALTAAQAGGTQSQQALPNAKGSLAMVQSEERDVQDRMRTSAANLSIWTTRSETFNRAFQRLQPQMQERIEQDLARLRDLDTMHS